MINKFDGEYFFLSNFYSCPIEYNGITYKNSEAAFQAQKCDVVAKRRMFSALGPSSAKSEGRRCKLRKDWENVKVGIMREVVFEKFKQNKDIRDLLIKTGEEYLEEGNTWGDRTWGTVNGEGRNMLGKILMEVRNDLG